MTPPQGGKEGDWAVDAREKTVFERISNAYYELTEAERKVADYVVIHQHDTQLMSISELSEACGVAEATVSRFCRRLNYSGYTAFKLAVANLDAGRREGGYLSGAVSSEDSIPDVAQKCFSAENDALAQTMSLIRPEDVQAAAQILIRARRVYCMGQGGSAIMALEAAHLFSTILPGFQAVLDSHLQTIAAANMGPEDAVLFFSYSGSTREVVELLPLVKERGAKILLVSRFPKSPAAAYADVCLQSGANELPLQHGSIPARVAQLFLLDVLFAEIYRGDEERCRAYKERVAAALSKKHI